MNAASAQPTAHRKLFLSTRDSFAGSVLGLSTIAILTKVSGFGEKVVVAHFFGTNDTADVYFAVTSVVLSLIWLVRELVHPSLLPAFAQTLDDPSQSATLFRRSFLLVLAFSALSAISITIFHETFVGILMPGFTGAKRQMAADLLQVMTPSLFFLSLAMVTYTVLNARRRFARAALPEALLKLAVVTGLICLVPSMGISSLAWIMGLGGFGCLLMQLAFIPERHSLLRRTGPRETCEAFHRMLLLMGPLVVGVVFSHANGLIDNVMASTLPRGQLSYLGYAKKLIDALLLVGPVALVTVVYSHLARLSSARREQEFQVLVSKAFRLLVYLSVPVGCILAGLREPMIRFLFERGQFDSASSSGTSQVFLIYALGLPVFSVEALLVHVFFASSDTKTPVKWGIVCGILDIVLALALLGPLQYLGIAWAMLVSRTAKVVALGGILQRRREGIYGAEPVWFLGRLAVCSLAAWGVLQLLQGRAPTTGVVAMAFRDLMLPAAGAALAFAACSYALRIEEFRAAVTLLRRRKAAVATFYKESP